MESNNSRSNSLCDYIDGDKDMSTRQHWSCTFREPNNRRIQNRLTRCLQKTRGPEFKIVLLRTFECIICNTEEQTLLEFGSQFVYYRECNPN